MEFAKLIDASTTLDGDGDGETSKSLIKCGTIVGGLSEQKQKRVLEVKRPPVLVGTPGRLWGLVSFVATIVVRVLYCTCMYEYNYIRFVCMLPC